ncbi:intracellular protein transport protein USO1 [Drosophila erecta]|uniref:THAP-type domain-containing protein n=1 Tax=Drosophila erecta TaxID=7220 RepID=B3NFX4_DROER|nr:intracellular protein transport protein USO1 [Drosophila erecta]EDV50736.2 uncharacterized protein Dere_GG14281 [Drosophila erecta]
MGGTKCCFRDCPVGSSRNPNMHFFKFPVKDPKRLKDWVRHCSNPDVSNAPPAKLAAKTVCARHFRVECFMNYKMDRLIPMQTPTLFRINRDLALDFESLDQNGEALLVKLMPPKQPHLIPPRDFECPLGFVDDETQNVEVIKKLNTVDFSEEEEQQKENDVADEVSGDFFDSEQEQKQSVVSKEKAAVSGNTSTTSTSGSVMPQNILDIISQLQPSLGIKLIKMPVTSQPISENILPLLEEQLLKEKTDDLSMMKTVTKEAEKHLKSTSCIIDVIEMPKLADKCQEKQVPTKQEYRQINRTVIRKRGMQEREADKLYEEQPTEEQSKKRKPPQEALNTDPFAQTENGLILNRNRQLQEKVWGEQKQTAKFEKPTQSIQENQSNPISETLSESCISLEENTLSSDSEDESAPDEKPSSSEDGLRDKLRQSYDNLQAEFAKLSEENAKLKRLQAEYAKASAHVKPAASSLTKAQLYMAIKKYVGPTMAALLRMEMFGGSEDRTWKDDEREFAIELLQLGDEVYKYCCDEWRFRLPSIRIARSWLEKKKTEDSEEFLDL